MTCFNVLVLIPKNTINIEHEVRKSMLPYYSYLDLEPYKKYLNKEDLKKEIDSLKKLPPEKIERMAKDWSLKNDDWESLAKANLEWLDEEIDGVDENGEYKITTYNPHGKWDWYKFIEKEFGDLISISYPCKVKDISEVVPYAIVTPDGEWHELGEEIGLELFFTSISGKLSVNERKLKWEQEVKELFEKHSEYWAIALSCHD